MRIEFRSGRVGAGFPNTALENPKHVGKAALCCQSASLTI
jgi:hypothetical protein